MRDVTIVGGSLAGLVTARRLQQHGLRPLVLEKSDTEGGLGNARISGGLIHLAWEPLDADPTTLERRLLEETDGEIAPDIAAALANMAREAIDWLGQEGVEMRPKSQVPYQKFALYPPRAGTARQIEPDSGPDRMVMTLYNGFSGAGGDVWLGCTAEDLRPGEAEGTWSVGFRRGSVAHREDSHAVVIADGGFQANQEMLTRYVGPNAGLSALRAMTTATGDGLRMLLANGASATGLGRVYGHMVSYSALVNEKLWPYPAVDKLCLTGALVNRVGDLINHRATTGVELVTLLARSEDPRGISVIFDDSVWNTAGKDNPYNSPVPNPDLVDRGGHHVTADSIDALERALGVKPGRLGAALEAHEASGGVVMNVPPFHAARVVPGITFTEGGAQIDATGAVIDRTGAPIPGMYAAGSAAGGIHGGPRGGYVGGLAVALEMGLIVADAIAAGNDAA
jgi:fumarate reductase flavoprotein subunit